MTGNYAREEQKAAPPIGLMPEKVWKQNRAIELANTISRWVDSGEIDGGIVAAWGKELENLLIELEMWN